MASWLGLFGVKSSQASIMRGGKNSLWAIAEYAWYPALLFVSTRYFVEYLGTYKYGSWMFLTAMVASSSILNVGIVGAVIKVISAELGGAAHKERLGEITNTALGMAAVSGAVTSMVMCVVLILGWRGQSLGADDLVATAAAGVVLILLEHFDASLSSVLKGGEHYRSTAKIEMVYKTAQVVLALAVSAIFSSLIWLYVSLVVVNSLRVFTKAYRVKSVFGLESLRLNFSQLSALIPYAGWGWLHGAGGFLLAVVDRLLVGSWLGVESLAYYSLLLMFPQQVHAVTAAALGVVFPRISGLMSAGKPNEIRALSTKMNWIAFFIAFLVTAVLLVFTPEIFTLWLGKTLPAEVMVVMLPLCLAFFVLCLNVPPHFTLLGMGQVRYLAILNMIAGIASLLVLLLLLEKHGLYAAAISKGVYGVILLFQFLFVNRQLRVLRESVA